MQGKKKRKEREKKRLAFPEPPFTLPGRSLVCPAGRDKRAGSGLPGILKYPASDNPESEQPTPGKQVAGYTEVSKYGFRTCRSAAF